jgi:hypothetical protein
MVGRYESVVLVPSSVPADARAADGGLTVRAWLASLSWALVIVAGFAVVHLVERFVVALPYDMRLVQNPSEFAMRVVGLGHHAVALFFLLTGAALRRPAGRRWLAADVALGLGLCAAFAALGGKAHPLARAGFYLFFLVHAFRDEVFFYDRYRERVQGRPAGRDASTAWLQVIAAGVLGVAMVPAYLYVAHVGGGPHAPAWLAAVGMRVSWRETALARAMLPGDWSFGQIFLVFGVPFVALLVAAAVRFAVAGARPVAVYRAHAPLVTVLAASVGLVLASVVVGAWPLYVIILVHFVAWFRFTIARLRDGATAPGAGRRSLVGWLRGTVPGFWVLHGGLTAVFLGLIAACELAIRSGPTLSPSWQVATFLMSSSGFFYWTIMHVALSLVPRRGPSA